MPDAKTVTALPIVGILPVVRTLWDSGIRGFEAQAERIIRAGLSEHGTLIGELTMTVKYETTLDGYRLFPEFEGTAMPEMVALVYRGFAVPHEEVLDGG